MEKSKLAYAVDELLRSVAIWLLSAICLRYAIKELYLIIVLSTAITMLTTLLLRIYYGKKNLTRKARLKTDEVMRELIIFDRSKLLSNMSGALNGTIESDAISTPGTVIYPYFCGKLPLEKLVFAYNVALEQNKKLIVLCIETTAEVRQYRELCSAVPIAILEKAKSYEFLTEHGLLPQVQKRSKKKVSPIRSALKKSKIKGYLAAALLLLFTAAFSPQALLCIIAAAVNITLSILCEILGN